MKKIQINKVVGYLKQKTGVLNIIFLLIIFGIILFSIAPSDNEQEKTIKDLSYRVNMYSSYIDSSKAILKQREIEVENTKKKIVEYETLLDCYVNQVDRVLRGYEISDTYCENIIIADEVSMIEAEIIPEGTIWNVYRNDWDENDERQEYINIIYDEIGIDGLLTFTGENTKWTSDRPSTETGFDGNRAYGFCQLYYTYHKSFINSEDFKNPYKQLEYCIGVWKNAESRGILSSTFQAYPTRGKWKYLFDFK